MIVELLPGMADESPVYQGIVALSPDREYVVLEVYCQGGGPSYFRIEHDPAEAPALFDARAFRMVSGALPSSWTAFLYGDGSVKFCPLSWQVADFWQAYLDRESWAVEAYGAERVRILAGERG